MQNITSALELKNAIQLLEVEREAKRHLLKEQFYIAYESFKPVNLLRSAWKDLSSSPFLVNNILGTSLGLAAGSLTKKIIIGTSENKVKKLIGTILQVGITNVITQNSDVIKSFGRFVFQHFFNKKEMNNGKQ